MSTHGWWLAAFASAALGFALPVHAGPPVTVTFQHLGMPNSPDATLLAVSKNEFDTYANAVTEPAESVSAGGADQYEVESPISPDVNYVVVRYRMGRKTCVFASTYVNASSYGGLSRPRWTKSAKASGGAICQAAITSTDMATHAWSVKFTMK
ncbi:hypothetical protein SAMN02800691_1405 [Luteibacter sp. UNCMF366Tsu5.1]|nr:hypothetical protein SAMN02800691_1405 [Luteibacter sp. UNCMF366Tsu5.1]